MYAIYFARDEFQRLVANYRRFLFRCNLGVYARQYEQDFQRFLQWSGRVHRRNLRALSAADFARLLEELSRRLVDFAELQFLAFVALEGPLQELERVLAPRPDGGSLLQAVVTPYRQTKIARARVELLRLVAARKTTAANLSAYVRRYAWLPVYEFIDPPMTVADVRRQVRRMPHTTNELRQYRRNRRESLRAYRMYLARVRQPRLRRLVQIAHAWAYLKEMRDDYRRHAYYLLIPFWREVARRTGLPFAQTNCLTADELLRFLSGNGALDKKIIAARQRRYALRLRHGRLEIYRGRQADRLARLVSGRALNRDVRGTVAYSGQASGRVRIISHRGEFKKFKPGEILVTTMTHPEFVPIMQQAAAIVTDEGGITCHAAIVARELGIPCIIGTKIATKVFNDGDVVEVDAGKGTVRILK